MKTKQGISLIVLIITIIVMIVLAGAIIISLNNSGIINKASDAVEESDVATIKELAQMAWGESYAAYKSGPDNLTEEALVAGLEKDVIAALKDNKVNTAEYGIKVTTKGVDIVKGWIQDGLEVRKGEGEQEQVIKIGDTIEYDETVDGTIDLEIKDITWQVLGASDDGELLILSNKIRTLCRGGWRGIKRLSRILANSRTTIR